MKLRSSFARRGIILSTGVVVSLAVFTSTQPALAQSTTTPAAVSTTPDTTPPSSTVVQSAVSTVAPTSAVTTTAASTASASVAPPVGRTLVVSAKDGKIGAKVGLYKTPNATSPFMTVANGKQSFGRVVFTVIEQQGDWIKVNTQVRPNGTTAWIKASDVTPPYDHAWKIKINVKSRQLTVLKNGAPWMVEKVAVGSPKYPTPLGTFYTQDLLRTKGAYGPYAYGLSGFSNVLQTFGAGDGRIGIHGTNAPSSIGQAVSHGCIRMRNSAITKLKSVLPLGVPVEITAA